LVVVFSPILFYGYFPELPPELEPEAPVPPAPVLEVGLPKMVWPDVFLLGAKTELKSCPIPCMVLQPVRLIPIKLIARSLESMMVLQLSYTRTAARCEFQRPSSGAARAAKTRYTNIH
jgi:hypothetical protein